MIGALHRKKGIFFAELEMKQIDIQPILSPHPPNFRARGINDPLIQSPLFK